MNIKNKISVNAKALFSIFCCALFAVSANAQSSVNDSAAHGTAITLGGTPAHTVGKLPAVGTQVKDFILTGVDLPSVNTGVCSKAVRKFNEEAAGLKNATVLCISKDLPFAQKQFCGAEGINNVVMLSAFRSDFGNIYGVQIADGVMRGLLSRAVIVIDQNGKIVYEQQVPEIGQEPNYTAAIAAVK